MDIRKYCSFVKFLSYELEAFGNEFGLIWSKPHLFFHACIPSRS